MWGNLLSSMTFWT